MNQPSAHTVTPAATPDPSSIEPPDERPAWLDQKFESPEALAEAYKQLESKLGAGVPAAQPTEAPAGEVPATPQVGLKIEAPQAPEAGGEEFNFQPYAEKVAAGETFSDEDYAALAAKGYQRPEVDQFVQGVQAQQQLMTLQVHEMAGGSDRYSQMAQWAARSQPKEWQDAYNNALGTGDMGTIRLALDGLKAAYQSANGHAPSGALSGSRPGTTGNPFANMAEMMEIQQSKEYLSGDPHFHAQFDARLAASSHLFE